MKIVIGLIQGENDVLFIACYGAKSMNILLLYIVSDAHLILEIETNIFPWDFWACTLNMHYE